MTGCESLIRRLRVRRTTCAPITPTVLTLGLLAARAGGDSSLTITANQGLSPDFSLTIHDYTIRCTGQPVVMSVNAPPGTADSVDRSALRSGGFSVSVPLPEGQEFPIAVRQSATTDHYYVRCLPSDFPSFTFTPENPVPQRLFTVDGLGPYLAAFNTDGVPVWWMKTQAGAFDSQVLPDGTVGFYNAAAGTNEIYSLTGDPIRAVSTVNGGNEIIISMRHTDAVWGVDRNTPNHVYTKPGDYFVRLTVTDDSGSADTVTQTVAIVGNEIQPPVASLVATPDTAREGAGIGFDASGSQAPGSTIGSYAWRFGDGKSRIGELTSHVYPPPAPTP